MTTILKKTFIGGCYYFYLKGLFNSNTNEKDSFKQLCKVLPIVIIDVVKNIKTREKNNLVYQELNDLSSDLLTSIYLLSFKKYEGFNDFKF